MNSLTISLSKLRNIQEKAKIMQSNYCINIFLNNVKDFQIVLLENRYEISFVLGLVLFQL